MADTSHWGRDHGHYDQPHCGGTMARSGKGGGARLHAQRFQAVLAFPAWGNKTGTDVYFSSRWDNDSQIYDHFHTPKTIQEWWSSRPWEYVFIQELPYDLARAEFVWDNAVAPLC